MKVLLGIPHVFAPKQGSLYSSQTEAKRSLKQEALLKGCNLFIAHLPTGRSKDLQCHRSVQRQLTGQVDRGLPASGQTSLDPVLVRDHGPGRKNPPCAACDRRRTSRVKGWGT